VVQDICIGDQVFLVSDPERRGVLVDTRFGEDGRGCDGDGKVYLVYWTWAQEATWHGTAELDVRRGEDRLPYCNGTPFWPLADVEMERVKQVQKGWTPAHDDGHDTEDLPAVAAYLTDPTHALTSHGVPEWGIHLGFKTGTDRRRQLIIAAALLVAEIERLDRVGARAAKESQ